ncbi:MAG: PD-(D/E)XK nuclease family protein [Candidatus Staskawiczbacteria bacterium]|nr:PD-(D/E)XK nuclease family protein [Candidatus Staskawiczbacteria bacterium]
MDSNDFMIVPPDISAIMGVIDTYAKWKYTNGGPRGFEKYHPSAFGKCLRLMQYLRYEERGLLKSKAGDTESKMVRLFDKGHNMHARWANYFEAIGVLRGIWECTNPMCQMFLDVVKGNEPGLKPITSFDISKLLSPRKYGKEDKLGCFKPEKCSCGNKDFKYQEITVQDNVLNMYGHTDMVLDFSKFNKDQFAGTQLTFNVDNLPTSPVVVDMKTANDYRFQQLIKNGPSLEYRIQLVIYANLLDLEYGVLIYENKNTSAVAAYKVNRDTDLVFSQIQKQAETMNSMTGLKLLPPPRPAEKDDYECSNCSFKHICHSSKIWDDPDLHKKRKSF